MYVKIMKINAKPPSEAFGKTFTNYLSILGLLLCLYWQVEYSGAGIDWKANIQCIEEIFNAILVLPEL